MDSDFEFEDAEKRQLLRSASLQKEIESIQNVMQTSGGRYFVFQLLTKAGVFRSCFNTEATVMSWLEGKRELGLFVLGLITRHCPDLYSLMMDENNE
jgi:hypothetical protein